MQSRGNAPAGTSSAKPLSPNSPSFASDQRTIPLASCLRPQPNVNNGVAENRSESSERSTLIRPGFDRPHTPQQQQLSPPSLIPHHLSSNQSILKGASFNLQDSREFVRKSEKLFANCSSPKSDRRGGRSRPIHESYCTIDNLPAPSIRVLSISFGEDPTPINNNDRGSATSILTTTSRLNKENESSSQEGRVFLDPTYVCAPSTLVSTRTRWMSNQETCIDDTPASPTESIADRYDSVLNAGDLYFIDPRRAWIGELTSAPDKPMIPEPNLCRSPSLLPRNSFVAAKSLSVFLSPELSEAGSVNAAEEGIEKAAEAQKQIRKKKRKRGTFTQRKRRKAQEQPSTEIKQNDANILSLAEVDKASFSDGPSDDEAKHQQQQYEEDPSKLYCYCQTPYDETKFYIQCDGCDEWFHGLCVQVSTHLADEVELWFCRNCTASKGRRAIFKVRCLASLAAVEARSVSHSTDKINPYVNPKKCRKYIPVAPKESAANSRDFPAAALGAHVRAHTSISGGPNTRYCSDVCGHSMAQHAVESAIAAGRVVRRGRDFFLRDRDKYYGYDPPDGLYAASRREREPNDSSIVECVRREREDVMQLLLLSFREEAARLRIRMLEWREMKVASAVSRARRVREATTPSSQESGPSIPTKSEKLNSRNTAKQNSTSPTVCGFDQRILSDWVVPLDGAHSRAWTQRLRAALIAALNDSRRRDCSSRARLRLFFDRLEERLDSLSEGGDVELPTKSERTGKQKRVADILRATEDAGEQVDGPPLLPSMCAVVGRCEKHGEWEELKVAEAAVELSEEIKLFEHLCEQQEVLTRQIRERRRAVQARHKRLG